MHRTAGGNPREDAFFARQAPRHVLGLGLADVFQPVDALLVVDLRQVGFRPLADTRDLRALLGLAADDLDLAGLPLAAARAAQARAGRPCAGAERRDLA